MFNYNTTQLKATALLTKFGIPVTLQKASGSSLKTYGVWGSVEKHELAPSVSQTVGEMKVIFVCGNLKKLPEINDNIVLGTASWSIKQIVPIQPALTVLAYKLTVTN